MGASSFSRSRTSWLMCPRQRELKITVHFFSHPYPHDRLNNNDFFHTVCLQLILFSPIITYLILSISFRRSTHRSSLHPHLQSGHASVSPCTPRPHVPLCCVCWRGLWQLLRLPSQVRGWAWSQMGLQSSTRDKSMTGRSRWELAEYDVNPQLC